MFACQTRFYFKVKWGRVASSCAISWRRCLLKNVITGAAQLMQNLKPVFRHNWGILEMEMGTERIQFINFIKFFIHQDKGVSWQTTHLLCWRSLTRVMRLVLSYVLYLSIEHKRVTGDRPWLSLSLFS